MTSHPNSLSPHLSGYTVKKYEWKFVVKSIELTLHHLFSSCLHVPCGIRTDCATNESDVFVVLDT